jgi:hypothetical protein
MTDDDFERFDAEMHSAFVHAGGKPKHAAAAVLALAYDLAARGDAPGEIPLSELYDAPPDHPVVRDAFRRYLAAHPEHASPPSTSKPSWAKLGYEL